MAITSFTPNQQNAVLSSLPYPTVVLTTLVAGNQTVAIAALLGGLIFFPAGGAETLTLPTAAQVNAAIPSPVVGRAFEFTIRNTAGGANTATVAAGSGGTTSGTMTIAQNNSKRFLLVITGVKDPLTPGSVDSYTLYSLGTVVH